MNMDDEIERLILESTVNSVILCIGVLLPIFSVTSVLDAVVLIAVIMMYWLTVVLVCGFVWIGWQVRLGIFAFGSLWIFIEKIVFDDLLQGIVVLFSMLAGVAFFGFMYVYIKRKKVKSVD